MTSRTTNAVQIVPSALPARRARRGTALYHRLGVLLRISGERVAELVEKGETAVPYAPVTIKTDAGPGVLTVLGERQSEFPGVSSSSRSRSATTPTAMSPRRCSATSARSPKTSSS